MVLSRQRLCNQQRSLAIVGQTVGVYDMVKLCLADVVADYDNDMSATDRANLLFDLQHGLDLDSYDPADRDQFDLTVLLDM